jgi:hypothetical protein
VIEPVFEEEDQEIIEYPVFDYEEEDQEIIEYPMIEPDIYSDLY